MPMPDPAYAAAAAEAWALLLTSQPSVTGTPDEAAFGPWLARHLRAAPGFATPDGAAPEVWTFPVRPGDARCCVAMLLRGGGPRTVLLTGHYDTVAIDDYGPLRAFATHPERLGPALAARLADHAATPAERRARADLASGAFLPGRGLLDMKAGLAAGLVAMQGFAADPARTGNLLFLAVPDEEAGSAGARAAATRLPAMARARGLELVAAINLDAIADDGDGAEGRAVALGSVGKLLPTAFVAGVATHAGFPLAGINAAVLAGAIAARMEWAAELTDAHPEGGRATPPSLLLLRDGKAGYDVTTPGAAFAAWNVIVTTRTPDSVLTAFEALCAEAAAATLATLRTRAAATPPLPLREGAGGRGHAESPPPIPILRAATLEAELRARRPEAAARLDALRHTLAATDLSLPEQCRRITEQLWAESGRAGPAVVVGFGSVPYPPVTLSAAPAARALDRAARAACAEVAARHGASIAVAPLFAGISDMSFLGEADAAALAVVAANTPVWDSAVRWPAGGGIAGVPIVNAGPWGRDYHTPLERLHAPYAFTVLPDLIATLAARVLAGG